jgi:uncharacterized membrane protein
VNVSIRKAKTADRDFAPAKDEAVSRGLNSILERNIQALMERRREEAAAATNEQRIAIAVSRVAGRMSFVYAQLAIAGLWIWANIGGLPGIPRFDPSLVLLGTAASVEAIFLSTFVLISQNRMSAAADKRADLDLQIGLLTEHELTKLLSLMSGVAQKLGVQTDVDQEVEELKQEVAPEAVLDKLDSVGVETTN